MLTVRKSSYTCRNYSCFTFHVRHLPSSRQPFHLGQDLVAKPKNEPNSGSSADVLKHSNSGSSTTNSSQGVIAQDAGIVAEDPTENYDQPNEMDVDSGVLCIVLRNKELEALVHTDAQHLVRPFKALTTPYVVLVRDTDYGFSCVAQLQVSSEEISGKNAAKKALDTCGSMLDKDLNKTRLDMWKKIHLWKVEQLDLYDEPSKVNFPTSILSRRSSGFYLQRSCFDTAVAKHPPNADLMETAMHFVDLLSPENRSTLSELLRSLDGKNLRIGTTCSGTDIAVTVVRKTIAALNMMEAPVVSLRINICIYFSYIYIHTVYIYIYNAAHS